MHVERTAIDGLLVISPEVYSDERGFFVETFQHQRYVAAGLTPPFVQSNRSFSKANVLRGVHYQVMEPQGHLVTVFRGVIYDVGVDLRTKSPTFGRWFGTRLDAHDFKQVYLPPGVAHGFCVLSSEGADMHYLCTALYRPDDEGGLLWNDPALNIDWPITEPLISERDRRFPRLEDIPPERRPQISGDRAAAKEKAG